MAKLIITTVGTTVISSGTLINSRFNNDLKGMAKDTKPNTYDTMLKEAAAQLKTNIDSGCTGKNISAEAASLKAFNPSADDKIVFVASGTLDGQFCAEVNRQVFAELNKCVVHEAIIVIESFKTQGSGAAKGFAEKGRKELNAKLAPLLNGYTEKYFNITGGFKAIIPFATTFAFQNRMSLIYLYEEGSDLIEIKPPDIFNLAYTDETAAVIVYPPPIRQAGA